MLIVLSNGYRGRKCYTILILTSTQRPTEDQRIDNRMNVRISKCWLLAIVEEEKYRY